MASKTEPIIWMLYGGRKFALQLPDGMTHRDYDLLRKYIDLLEEAETWTDDDTSATPEADTPSGDAGGGGTQEAHGSLSDTH